MLRVMLRGRRRFGVDLVSTPGIELASLGPWEKSMGRPSLSRPWGRCALRPRGLAMIGQRRASPPPPPAVRRSPPPRRCAWAPTRRPRAAETAPPAPRRKRRRRGLRRRTRGPRGPWGSRSPAGGRRRHSGRARARRQSYDKTSGKWSATLSGPSGRSSCGTRLPRDSPKHSGALPGPGPRRIKTQLRIRARRCGARRSEPRGVRASTSATGTASPCSLNTTVSSSSLDAAARRSLNFPLHPRAASVSSPMPSGPARRTSFI